MVFDKGVEFLSYEGFFGRQWGFGGFYGMFFIVIRVVFEEVRVRGCKRRGREGFEEVRRERVRKTELCFE